MIEVEWEMAKFYTNVATGNSGAEKLPESRRATYFTATLFCITENMGRPHPATVDVFDRLIP